MGDLDKYGQMGVKALKEATPVDSGKTADSWYYTITHTKTGVVIDWHNSNISEGSVIAVLLQYGHAEKDGTFINGVDYINPALVPAFNEIADLMWKEVTKK